MSCRCILLLVAFPISSAGMVSQHADGQPVDNKIEAARSSNFSCRGHAHNDYYHPRPLRDALEWGFGSVEADIFLNNGELQVGHDRGELVAGRTLESLYLDPLQAIVERNGGFVLPACRPFTLLVDIKADGADVYRELQKRLPRYREMLCRVRNGKFVEGAVQIVISGDRPEPLIVADPSRLVGIDGRLTDLDSQHPAHLMPMISDRWGSHFSWRGRGPMPTEQRVRLQRYVRQAHRRGRRIRFWGTPESPDIWRELLDAGVDHLNTDSLPKLGRFLNEASTASAAR